MSILLVNGSATRLPLPDGSVHCIVTSPPYWGMRDYGLPASIWPAEGTEAAECRHEWVAAAYHLQRHSDDGSAGNLLGKRDGQRATRLGEIESGFCRHCGAWRGSLGLEPEPELYVWHLVLAAREWRRVLHPSGTLWLNLGDSYAGSWGNHGARKGQQRSRIAQRWHRRAYEDARQGWDGLPPTAKVAGLKPKDLVGIPWEAALALRKDGWWLRRDIPWIKSNSMPESVADRPSVGHEYLFLLTKGRRYYYDRGATAVPATGSKAGANGRGRRTSDWYNDSLEIAIRRAQQWLEQAKAARDNGGMLSDMDGRPLGVLSAVARYPGAHFAVFPPSLVEPCILAGTPEYGVCADCGAPWRRLVAEKKAPRGDRFGRREIGAFDHGQAGTTYQQVVERRTTGWEPTCRCAAGRVPAVVLDPFAGTGTTLEVARALGRHGVGVDLSYDYLRDQAWSRLELDRLMALEQGLGIQANEEPDWQGTLFEAGKTGE